MEGLKSSTIFYYRALNKKHCHKSGSKTNKKESFIPLLGGIFIALIPKCPFCILAYGSAITLCSGATIYDHSPAWTNYISLVLIVITFAMVILNYKGLRTIIAAIMILCGSYFIVRSELYTGEIDLYYWGASILMIGIWINASFYFFYRKWILPVLTKFSLLLRND